MFSSMEKCETSCEPMDVDISINSHNTSFQECPAEIHEPLDLDGNLAEPQPIISSVLQLQENVSNSKPEVWNVKKYHIIMKTAKKKSPVYSVLTALLVFFVSLVIYIILDIKCTEELDLVELKNALNHRVHGQTEAIDNLLEGLSIDVNSKIIFLYGGTGVGKTYSTSILLESVWNSSNVYHYTMPSFVDMFSVEGMFGMNICKTSLVVVDDLKVSDFSTVKKLILNLIKKSKNLNKKITVILICNCDVITKELHKSCSKQFYAELTKTFDDVHITKKIVKYKPLTQETLKKCIEDQLGVLEVRDHEFKNLLNNFDVTLDGCKGVYKKVKFMYNL